jgi:DNA-binding NarL/FixJ family response regulator
MTNTSIKSQVVEQEQPKHPNGRAFSQHAIEETGTRNVLDAPFITEERNETLEEPMVEIVKQVPRGTPVKVGGLSSPPDATFCLVTDDEQFCRVVVPYLQTSEFRCLGVYRWPEHAIEGIPKKRPDFIVIDVLFRRMRGTECLWRLKQVLRRVKILVVAPPDPRPEKLVWEVLSNGADGYVEKSLPYTNILSALRLLRTGGIPLADTARASILSYFRAYGSRPSSSELLSSREQEIMAWASRGLNDSEIAGTLGIGLSTVRTHLHHVNAKLGTSSRAAAVARLYCHSVSNSESKVN